MSKKVLSKADILSADDMKRESVEVPEWGGVVYIKRLTADERDLFEFKMLGENKSGKGLRAAYVGLAMVDEMGERLFKDDEIPMLGAKFAGVVDRVFERVSEINRISEKDLKDLEKN